MFKVEKSCANGDSVTLEFMIKLQTANCHKICLQCFYEQTIYTVINSETIMHIISNK